MSVARLTLILLALLGASLPVWADPVTLVAIAVSYAGITGAIAAGTAFGLHLLLGLYASSEARRKASAQADAQRAAYNASLQDRNVTVLRNDAPWQVIYGSPAPVGGALVAMFTSGNRDEFKHLVIVFAAHECVAIDEVYIEGDPLGTLDADGWVQTGSKFFEDASIVTSELVTLVADVGTLSHVPLSIISAVEDVDGGQINYAVTTNGTTTITVPGGGNASLVITYSFDTSVARINVQKHLSPDGVDVADAFLISKVPSQWTTAHKLSGYTYIVITLDLSMPRFQGGPPNITAKLRGKKVYDYRQPLNGLLAPGSYSVPDVAYITSFLRASTGTYMDTDGLLKTAAVDVPRFECSGPWAANYLSGSDCTIANAYATSNVANAAPISGDFTSSIQFGDNSVPNRYYYKAFAHTVGWTYKLSIFIKMDDGLAPVPSTSAGSGDFLIIINGIAAAGAFDIVNLGGGVYRVANYVVASAVSQLVGVLKYSTQSARGFRVTGYMLDDGVTLNDYVPSVTGPVFQALPAAVVRLLVEEARTNLFLWARDFTNAAWTKGGLTPTPNAARAPDGTMSATVLTEDTSTGVHRIYQVNAVTIGSSYASAFIVKANGRKKVEVIETTLGGTTFDLIAGTVSNPSVGGIEPLPAGWFKIFIKKTATGTPFVSQLRLMTDAGSASYTGDGASGILIWHGQFELGADDSSPIPTTAAPVTRAADVCTVTNVLYSTNPALCTADFLRADHGFAAGANQIDSAAAIAAANACDAQGYNCNGALSTDASRDSNLLALEESMAGRTHWSGGVWRMQAGAWTSPVMDLTDADLAAPIEVTQAANVRSARYNSVRGSYAPASQLGVVTDYTPYTVPAYVAADGYAQWLNASYGFTATNGECQKLAAIAVERSRAGLTIVYPAHLRAWKLQPGDRVTVTNAELGFAAKTFRVVDWTHVNNAPVGLVLTEDVASMYTGTFSATDPLAPTSTLADPWAKPAAPGGFTAHSGTAQLLLNKDGSVTTRVLCSWSPSAVRAVLQGGYCQIQWRLATATDDQWISADLPPDASSTYLAGVKDSTNILVRVRYITGVGAQGYWSTILHFVVGKTAAPSTPTGVSISGGLVYWSAVTDLDVTAGGGYYLRAIAGSTPSWGAGTPLHTGKVTAIPFAIPKKLYGVQTIMVVAVDSSGNISAPAYSTFDFSSASTGNVVQSVDYQATGFPGTLTDCTVSGGNLVADVDPTSDIYGLPDLYSQPDVYASTFLPMQWVSQAFVPRYNGTLTLLSSITGDATIEYMVDGGLANDAYALADVYASADLYGNDNTWQPWPGALEVKRMQGILFRISVAGGSVQGMVSALAAYFSMPAVRQAFSSVAIQAAGTRLAPAAGSPAYGNWVAIHTVQVTPIADGSGAVNGQILDLVPQLGPAVQLLNNSGAPTTGTANIDIGGLVDV